MFVVIIIRVARFVKSDLENGRWQKSDLWSRVDEFTKILNIIKLSTKNKIIISLFSCFIYRFLHNECIIFYILQEVVIISGTIYSRSTGVVSV